LAVSRQRLAAAEATATAAAPSSDPFSGNRLLYVWLYDWAWGELPANRLVRYARAAVLDLGSGTSQLLKQVSNFSELHAHRQLTTLFCKTLAPVDPIEGSCVNSIVYPHKLFAALYKHFPEKAARHVGDKNTAFEFWTHFLVSPTGAEFAQRHPALIGRTAADLQYCIPLVGHSALDCKALTMTTIRISHMHEMAHPILNRTTDRTPEQEPDMSGGFSGNTLGIPTPFPLNAPPIEILT
jgi:hypothetical protein